MKKLAHTQVAVCHEDLNLPSKLRVFRNIKLKALKVVKLIAIAVSCITAGVYTVGTAQALTTSGGKLTLRNDTQSAVSTAQALTTSEGKLTLRNNTQSEVLIFLHKDGESGAYTRYAYLPACTELTMLEDYSHGWHISQDLRWKLPLIPTRTGIAKVYTSSFNGLKYEKLCQQATRSVGSTYTSGLGWGTKPASATTISVRLSSQLIGQITASNLDKYLTNQTLGQAGKIKDLPNNKSVTKFQNNFGQFLPGGTKEEQNWFRQQKKINADKFFEEQTNNLLVPTTKSDTEIETAGRIQALRELADHKDLDNFKKVLKNICNLTTKPSDTQLYSQTLIKAAEISNSQNFVKMEKPVGKGGAMVELKRTPGGLESQNDAMIKERYCPKSDGENRQRVERKNYI